VNVYQRSSADGATNWSAEVNMVQATPHRNYQTIKPQRVLIILMAMTQRRLQMVQGTSSPSGPRASQGLEAGMFTSQCSEK
jgi:hypothetical protein